MTDTIDTTITVRQFFNGLAAGSHVVRPNSSDVMVWSGMFSTRRAPILFSRDYAGEQHLEMADNDNDWTAVVNPNSGEYVVADTMTIRLMQRSVSRAQQISANTETIVQMRTDWERLNAHINAYANETNMCSDYEARLDRWNEDFQTLQLEGRKREFRIGMRVDASYYVTVTVEATSEDAARDEANEMHYSDVMEYGSWDSPDNVEVEITD